MKITVVEPASGDAGSPAFEAPMMQDTASCGFPNPASDHLDRKLDLNEYLIRHPSATFFARAGGDSMEGSGIFDGDILIVDRAATAVQGDVVIAVLDGGLTCKILDIANQRLLGGSDTYSPIPIPDDLDFAVEGVVISSIRLHRAINR